MCWLLNMNTEKVSPFLFTQRYKVSFWAWCSELRPPLFLVNLAPISRYSNGPACPVADITAAVGPAPFTGWDLWYVRGYLSKFQPYWCKPDPFRIHWHSFSQAKTRNHLNTYVCRLSLFLPGFEYMGRKQGYAIYSGITCLQCKIYVYNYFIIRFKVSYSKLL